MTTVLAAVDDTEAAAAVLQTAQLIAQALSARLRAVHAGQSPAPAREHARRLGIDMEELAGPADDAVLQAATDPELDLVVVGLHQLPGEHVTDHLVHALAQRMQVPLVVVPPGAPLNRVPTRIMFPVNGSRTVTAAARPVIATYVAAGFEVLALHVYNPSTVPAYHDGVEDELVWRDEFLAQHFAELDLQLTTRPGPLVPALLEAAITHEVDIIALPAEPEASQRVTSVLHRVLAGAGRPVALVPLRPVRPVGLAAAGQSAHGAGPAGRQEWV